MVTEKQNFSRIKQRLLTTSDSFTVYNYSNHLSLLERKKKTTNRRKIVVVQVNWSRLAFSLHSPPNSSQTIERMTKKEKHSKKQVAVRNEIARQAEELEASMSRRQVSNSNSLEWAGTFPVATKSNSQIRDQRHSAANRGVSFKFPQCI